MDLEAMSDEESKRKRAPLGVVLALLALAAFMYVSIMYKIIKFGP